MSVHSVVEARNQLSALIERAEAGEHIVITRHGQPVAELRPVKTPKGPVSKEDMDWIAARGIPRLTPGLSAVEVLLRMREEND